MKLTIFSGVNSIGMPYHRFNFRHIGYFDYLCQYFRERGYEVTGYNLSSLSKNETKDLASIFDGHKSLADVKRIQGYSLDYARKNPLFKMFIPNGYQKYFIPSLEDEKVIIRDEYEQADETVFVYHTGVNDFFADINSGPFEVIFKDVRDRLPEYLKLIVVNSVENIKDNWDMMVSLNPRVQIYALSFFCSPLYELFSRIIYFQKKKEDFDLVYGNYYTEYVELFNACLERAAREYANVTYVDITDVRDYCSFMDFHQNIHGNRLIADKIIQSIEEQKVFRKSKV